MDTFFGAQGSVPMKEHIANQNAAYPATSVGKEASLPPFCGPCFYLLC